MPSPTEFMCWKKAASATAARPRNCVTTPRYASGCWHCERLPLLIFNQRRQLADRGRAATDAVCPPQTHPETRSAAITRAERRPRRIPPRSHRSKPPQARHADPNANADLSNLRRHAAHEHGRDRRSPPPQYFKTDFFNGIAPQPPFAAAPGTGSVGWFSVIRDLPGLGPMRQTRSFTAWSSSAVDSATRCCPNRVGQRLRQPSLRRTGLQNNGCGNYRCRCSTR